MKRLFSILALAVAVTVQADNIQVQITDVDNPEIRAAMEATVGVLLDEANAAQTEGRELNTTEMHLNDGVSTSLSMLWENTPFECVDQSLVLRALTTSTGWQVRNIPLMMRPIGGNFNEREYHEAVIDFDRKGHVESFHLTIDQQLYMQVIKSNLEMTDLRRRQLILDYVERFRTAYNEKNKNFLEEIFSDDALIITGKVVSQRTKDGIKLPDKISYKKQGKREYLNNLFAIFDSKGRIDVSFDGIDVMRHPVKPDFYGVTLHQGWSTYNKNGTPGYHDDGYVFLLWDFRDELHPQIHVRTWQPDAFDQTGSGKKQPIPKSQVFSLADFDLDED